MAIDTDIYEEERAFPEARLYKQTLLEIMSNMLYNFKQYRLGGKKASSWLVSGCSEMLSMYDYLEPKILKVSKKNEEYKELLKLSRYITSVDYFINNTPLIDIMKYKSLIVSFIERIGITKIEQIQEVDPTKAVLDGLFS